MKKIFAFLMACLAILPATADRYCALRSDQSDAEQGWLYLAPNDDDQMYKTYMVLHLDAYIDKWNLKVTHPATVNFSQVEEGPALSIPYINRLGADDIYHAALLVGQLNMPQSDGTLTSSFAAQTDIMGYWYSPYNPGELNPYGSVKWPDGDHDYLFSMWMHIPCELKDFDLTFDLTLSTTYDYRPVLCMNSHSVKNFHVHVGSHHAGDVNGDENVNVADVTQLIDLLIDGETSHVFLQEVDIDGDGRFTIADVTALIDLLLNSSD